ncbi:MAG: 2Fe-2S iron-sulfur cluster binding domain-containing protein [Gammaproteobacteria bacterium]|jgi:CDP-4-dehydro-6-deoxyglucose reductase|nr:2Fe-2S iron-sulfur cluster binding domain-containing protein [Gammaproteobacteria bacterium]MBT6668864.1 2Fe-2S iron-sulfur cluster binding domain-containing protein [Gammaproteobacteria bacterium]MBT8006450.1 2Fe-2S iron-sulfur cluster binding domain-containing protein [Gammaproteobacteria bacterium]
MSSIFEINLPVNQGMIKTFECSRQESILQAGLRAGLPLRYKCTNGSCGECKTQLIEGEVRTIGHQDFHLSPQEQQQGWFLSCTHAPKSTLNIAAPMFNTVQQIPHQCIQAKVKKISLVDKKLAILTLRTPRSNTFQFLAGQNVVLSHHYTERCYPIASCPCSGGELEFHIRNRDSDPFSQRLFNTLKRGETVTIKGPQGQFSLDEHSTRHLVFIAWEHGFAPIRSLVEHFISLEMDNPVSLYWIAKQQPYMENHANSWHSVLDPFDYHWVQPQSTDFETQAIQLLDIIQEDLLLEMSDFYISVPAPMLITLSELLLTAGVDEAQLHASPI